jgi:tRNA pseudouridine55 synthase
MDGLLIIDKPPGMTSHDVVSKVRHLLHERRIGHTGTLDPFATGVLVILVGRATRLAQFLSGVDKEYEAIIRFGFSTETGDRTGSPTQSA